MESISLQIKGIVKGYGKENIILNGFSLEINKGEVMCLLGANGSGKTTLVNILAGLTEF
jgi:ABC-type multidrug transport system ATPase subunit